MSEELNTTLNNNQCSLLLDGLTYVRSHLLLEFRDPAEDDAAAREQQLQEVENLMLQLKGKQPVRVAAGV